MLTDAQIAEQVVDRLRRELAAVEPPGDLVATLHRRLARRGAAIRRARLASGAAAATVAAVALTVALAGAPAPGGPAGWRGRLTVQELAYRTAAVAAARPAVRPGQWVYWKEKVATPGCPRCSATFEVWTTADNRKAAYVYRGTAHLIVPPRAAGSFVGQPEVFVHEGRVSYGYSHGRLPVSYVGLRSLPSRPRALARYLGSVRNGYRAPVSTFCAWSREASACASSFREFRRISDLLISYVMPPRLTAELYRALADIPGVTVDTHATDAAGRPGVAFAITAVGETDEIIMNPRTFRLMGTKLVLPGGGGYPAQVLGETAILRMAMVSGPGVRP